MWTRSLEKRRKTPRTTISGDGLSSVRVRTEVVVDFSVRSRLNLFTRKIQIKAIMRYYYTLTIIAKIKKKN